MKRIVIIVGLLLGLASGVAAAQTRVGISLSFGDPNFAGQVVIGRPYYHRHYAYHYNYRYRPGPVIVVGPGFYQGPRVVVVRPYRRYARRYHGHW